MPQTFTQLHYHIVFSTKSREPTLTTAICERSWDYLGVVIRGDSGISHRVGGVADHVHLLVTLPQTRSISDVVRKLKSASSTWIHETIPQANVSWQTGYGAFTVSHSALPAVVDYFERQAVHHATRSFQNEFRLMLSKHGLEPDEQYI